MLHVLHAPPFADRGSPPQVTGMDCSCVLFFDCPEEVMEKRLLGRNEGRADDNIETIRKRFKVFVDSSMPVIEEYEKVGKVRKVNSDRAPEAVYSDVRSIVHEYVV